GGAWARTPSRSGTPSGAGSATRSTGGPRERAGGRWDFDVGTLIRNALPVGSLPASRGAINRIPPLRPEETPAGLARQAAGRDGPRAGDGHALGDGEARLQRDVMDVGGEGDGVASCAQVGLGDGVAQGTGAAVGPAGDQERGQNTAILQHLGPGAEGAEGGAGGLAHGGP